MIIILPAAYNNISTKGLYSVVSYLKFEFGFYWSLNYGLHLEFPPCCYPACQGCIRRTI